MPLLIHASVGFSAFSSIIQVSPAFCAPSMRSSLQRITTRRLDYPECLSPEMLCQHFTGDAFCFYHPQVRHVQLRQIKDLPFIPVRNGFYLQFDIDLCVVVHHSQNIQDPLLLPQKPPAEECVFQSHRTDFLKRQSFLYAKEKLTAYPVCIIRNSPAYLNLIMLFSVDFFGDMPVKNLYKIISAQTVYYKKSEDASIKSGQHTLLFTGWGFSE